MADRPRSLGELAKVVRSKNAGPFWITLDVFFRNDADYALVSGSNLINEKQIGRLYQVDANLVRIFELPNLRVMKISIPRPVVAGSFQDRDLHAGQQHVPLALLPVPGLEASNGD